MAALKSWQVMLFVKYFKLKKIYELIPIMVFPPTEGA